MAVGSSILSLLGNKDPREALLQSIVQGSAAAQQPTGGAPYATAQAGGGGATGAGPAAAAGVQASQPADSLASPPDLAKMFQEILTYDTRARNLDRGMGLIGSAVSQDGNREATLKAFTGEGGSNVGAPSLGGMAELAIGMQNAQVKAKQRAAMMAALPQIAEKYGLDLATAQYLYDTGQLDAVISEAEKPSREVIKNADGTSSLIDKNDNAVLGTFGPQENTRKIVEGPNGTKIMVDEAATDPAKANLGEVSGPNTMTDDLREYDAYVKDEQMRQTPPDKILSLQQWRMTKPPSTKIDNNIEAPKIESEFAKVLGKEQAEAMGRYGKAADNAMDMLAGFDVIEAGLNSGVRTGSFGETELGVRRFAQYLGVEDAENPEKVAGGELIQKMSNRMALLMRNPESGMGMPGSVSDKDIEFLKQSQIGLGSSEPGNRVALDVFRRLERRKMEYAELAEDYAREHKTLSGFKRHARKFFDSKPMFEDLKQQLLESKTPDERRTLELLEKYK